MELKTKDMYETIWSGKKVVEKDNKRVLNNIAVQEATCKEFPLTCEEKFGVWAIWFKVNEKYLLASPMDIVNTIYEDDGSYYILESYKENKRDIAEGQYIVVVNKWKHCYSWRIMHTNSNLFMQMQFTYKEYIGKITSCINEFNNVLSSNKRIAYNDLDINGIKMCKKQLEITWVLPSHYTLMAKAIKQENFIFGFLQKSEGEYEIGIDDRKYQTIFSHWDNDMECIRHQLESYVYEQEATVKLSFDMSETILKLSHRRILDKFEDKGDGYSYKYKDYILVEIIPNEFARMPIIKGFCDEKETIRSIYEGLLNMAYYLPANGKDSGHDDYPSNLVAYNRYKSPVIESFLRNDERVPNTYKTRQVHVKDIITIDPDYDGYLWDLEGTCSSLEYVDLYDKEGNPIRMEEFDNWGYEMNNIVETSATGKPYEKDWAEYHRRGLALAHKLREVLSTDFDLWYEAPFEDKSGTIDHRMLII